MAQTIVIYVGMLFLSIVIATVAARKKDKRYFYLVVLLLALVAGLRGPTVGTDTSHYIYFMNLMSQGRVDEIYSLEAPFILFCQILLSVWNNPHFVLFIIALITHGCILLRLWDFRKLIDLPCAVGIYYCLYYFLSLNICRQLCCVAIVFYATRYLLKKDYIGFVLRALPAVVFHKSAVLLVLFFFLEVLMWRYLGEKQRRLLKVLLKISPFAIVAALIVFWRSLHYFLDFQIDIGLMLPIKLIFFLWSKNQIDVDSLLHKIHKPAQQKYVCRMIEAVEIYYVVGIFMTMLGYFYPYMERMGLLFYIFEIVYMALFLRRGKNKVVALLSIVLLFGYDFMVGLITNSNGQNPYLFIWQG